MIVWMFVGLVIFITLAGCGFFYCEARSPADWGGRIANALAGLVVLLCRHVHGLKDFSLSLPSTGPVVVASNHVSGLDPLLLIAASPRPLRFLIAREEYQRFGLNWLFRLAGCIPVDRESRPETALREALRALADGQVVAVFPHGRIHLDRDPPRKLKGGVVRLAHRSGAPIYPVRIESVKGEGHTIAAVLMPGQARLRIFPSVECEHLSHQACLTKLAGYLEQPANP